MLATVLLDTRYALRRLLGAPGFSIAAIPFALAGGRLPASELVGVSQYDPLSFAVAAALLAGIVIFATIGPARRALRVAPTVALRYD